jgi:hypothetical protein
MYDGDGWLNSSNVVYTSRSFVPDTSKLSGHATNYPYDICHKIRNDRCHEHSIILHP